MIRRNIQHGLSQTLGLLCLVSTATAQLPNSDLARIDPPFGRAGESVTVTLHGQNLEDLRGLQFTHPGFKARAMLKPATEFLGKRFPDGTRFTVRIGPDVPPGIYEARVAGRFGISTARPFVVAPADSVEVNETSNNDAPDTAMELAINSTVFGSVPDRGIDWFKFRAEEGRRLLIQCLAERIDSRLDGLLILYDSAGNELDRNRQHFNRDPFLDFTAPASGDYLVALSHIIYRGGPEYFYRLSLSTAPQVDFVFPPAVEPGEKARLTLFGRNLPGGSTGQGYALDGKPLETVFIDFDMPAKATTPHCFHPGQPRQGMLRGIDHRYEDSNPFRIGFATAPVIAEDTRVEVQEVRIPAEIAGRFDQANDEDAYRFHAKKGQTYWLETIADQAGAPSDTAVDVFLVDDRAGQPVASNDDPASFFGGDRLDTIHFDTVDAVTSFTAEKHGQYEVRIRNQYGSGDLAHVYRLAIREARPDFDMIAASERPLPTNRTGYSVTPLLRRNGRWPLRVIVPRRDGFTGDITVTAESLPAGVTAHPLVLSGRQDRGALILSAAEDAEDWAGDIHVTGTATINGRRVVRPARFAALVWGHIFADSQRVRSRLTQRVPLGVTKHEEAPTIIAPAKHEYTVKLGESLKIPVKLIDNGQRKGTLTIQPHELYGMRNYPKLNLKETDSAGELSINFKNRSAFPVTAGRYQFTLMGIGTTRYRYAESAARALAADVARLEQIVSGLKEETSTAADAVASEEVNAPDAKETNERLARAEQELADIRSMARKAADRAREKTEKFAAWSDPITVTVLPND